jgi:hypothetical protein
MRRLFIINLPEYKSIVEANVRKIKVNEGS